MRTRQTRPLPAPGGAAPSAASPVAAADLAALQPAIAEWQRLAAELDVAELVTGLERFRLPHRAPRQERRAVPRGAARVAADAAAARPFGPLALTAWSYPRWAAPAVAARSRSHPGAAAATLIEVVAAAGALPHRPQHDPTPLLRTAELLVARGDRGGARLLLWTATLIHPAAPGVARELLRLTPRPQRFTALFAAGRGLSRADLAVLQVLGQRVRSLPGLPPRRPGSDQLWAVSGVLGLLSGWLPLVWFGEALTGVGDEQCAVSTLAAFGGWDGVARVSGAWALTSVVTAVALRAAWGRAVAVREARRQAASAAGRAAFGDSCHCGNARVLADDVAREYLHRHLAAPSVAVPATGEVWAAVGRGSRIAACPQRGTLWLDLPAEDGTRLLLRGAAAVPGDR